MFFYGNIHLYGNNIRQSGFESIFFADVSAIVEAADVTS